MPSHAITVRNQRFLTVISITLFDFRSIKNDRRNKVPAGERQERMVAMKFDKADILTDEELAQVAGGYTGQTAR